MFLENIHEAVATDIYKIESDKTGNIFKIPVRRAYIEKWQIDSITFCTLQDI